MRIALEPVSSRTTIQEGVYQQLRNALMAGNFDPGQTLTIASLAETFGTSNMPVREALRRLAAENALEVAPNGSARIPIVTLARLDDLCRARIAVEGLAAELGIPRLTATDIETLERIAAEQHAIGRSSNVYELMARNQQFHFTIYRASGSDVLLQLIETLWLRFGPYMRMLSASVEPLMRSGEIDPAGPHLPIIEALKAGDFARARDGVVADIRRTHEILRDYCPASEDEPRAKGPASAQRR
ncbi:GntR family transcriptional regulator [Rhizobium jaguaris]|uniref:GntR family transcriptional regulator n=1 Tax=Rhizobium jaguaris TaxID=1312183 RepID=A0A387FLB5_9HYPH|nr:GntR family transcriptional regulator [Rhizobium jaguaris]AYG60210.1 GntR family transcriptional regulator [Rhizobium jaguaris]